MKLKIMYCITLPLVLALCTACSKKTKIADASGTFESTEIIVSAEGNGKIMQFNLEEGDSLEAGVSLGYIDSTQLYLKKRQLESSVRSVDIRKPDIQKQIAIIEQQIAVATSELHRFENLVRAKAGNQKQVDDYRDQIEVLQRQLAAQQSTLSKTSLGADAEVQGIVYQIMQIDDQLQKCNIINPRTGTVLVKYAEAGEVTANGKPLYKVADTGLLNLRAYVTADQLTQLKLDQRVRVFADFGEKDQREYPGVITWISSQSEFTPKGIQTRNERDNLVYAIKVAVVNDGYLKIGQYGEVLFE